MLVQMKAQAEIKICLMSIMPRYATDITLMKKKMKRETKMLTSPNSSVNKTRSWHQSITSWQDRWDSVAVANFIS